MSRAPLLSTRAAWGCAAGLVALGVLSSLARIQLGEGVARWTELFNLDAEANVPTWFGSILLLRCALASARYTRALAAVFVALSIDEVAMVHERAAAALLERSPGSALPWLLGGVVVAALGTALVPALRRLPAAARARAAAAGALYVAGALGVEALGQRFARRHGWWNPGYVGLAALEEAMEMAGAILYVDALVRAAAD